jgi:hypothetical protein
LSDEANRLLDSVAVSVVAHLRDGRRAVIETYFKAGDEIHRLRSTAVCGPRAVRLLAERIGMDESGLQKWGRMAEVIRGEERVAICGLVDAAMLPLTPSLIVELQRVRNAEDRMELARAALEQGLSVEQLRTRILTWDGRASPKSRSR